MTALIHYIYSSTARQAFSEDDLVTLLSKARAKNESLGITGMLLHTDGSFFQVLEGEADAVDALVKKISEDQRHFEIVTIIREPISRRAFAEWTMGFANMTLSEVQEISGANDFFSGASCFASVDHGRAKKLISAFRGGRWRSRMRNTNSSAPVANNADSGSGSVQVRGVTMKSCKVSYAFQPIVDIVSGEVVSYEAGVRGANNEPASVVLQQMNDQERASFDTDCRSHAIGMASRLGLKCNLNLGYMALDGTDWREGIRSTIDAAEREQIDPSRLVLEIDQDRLLVDSTVLPRVIEEYRVAGLRISIDHFGAGRAGLNLLEPYRPDMISLNTNLIRGINSNGPRQAIVRGVMQTCMDLAIDLVAKHVDTLEEFQWLVDEGVTLFQGNLFASPGFELLPKADLPNSVMGCVNDSCNV